MGASLHDKRKKVIMIITRSLSKNDAVNYSKLDREDRMSYKGRLAQMGIDHSCAVSQLYLDEHLCGMAGLTL